MYKRQFLLLTAIGVDRDQIIEDYLLTNVYLKSFVDSFVGDISKKIGIQEELVKTIFLAKEEYLGGAITSIEDKYGTIKNYMQEELELGPEQVSILKRLLVDY